MRTRVLNRLSRDFSGRGHRIDERHGVQSERAVMRKEGVRASVVAVVALSLLAAGCAPVDAEPVPTPSATAAPQPTATAEPDPELVVGGTAGQNRPFFEFLLTGLLATDPQPTSQTIVNTLATGGFDKASMEVTADTTPVGQRADSILVSVKIDGQCLIGQVIASELNTELADVLGTGRCLVGRTLSIDW
jgi:uncharacterized lipoprotein YajG